MRRGSAVLAVGYAARPKARAPYLIRSGRRRQAQASFRALLRRVDELIRKIPKVKGNYVNDSGFSELSSQNDVFLLTLAG
jgi:hypothetical protein